MQATNIRVGRAERMQPYNIRVGRADPLCRGNGDHLCTLCRQWFTADDYLKHQAVSGIKVSTVVTPPRIRRKVLLKSTSPKQDRRPNTGRK